MILLNGKPYAIDTPFTDSNGTQYPANWYRLATQQQRTAVGFTEVPDPPPIDERFYYINTDGSVTQKPLSQCQDYYKNQLASIRWTYESKGIVYDNHKYSTDQQSRVNYLGAFIQASANPNFTVQWKALKNDESNQSEFVTLNANDVINIVNGGTDYISKCFAHEELLRIDVDAATTLNEMLMIDLNTGWPNNSY
jgi:hypothetical protein